MVCDRLQQFGPGMRRPATQRSRGKIASLEYPLDEAGVILADKRDQKLLIDDQLGDALANESLEIEG